MKFWAIVAAIVSFVIVIVITYFVLKSQFIKQGELNQIQQQVKVQVEQINEKIEATDARAKASEKANERLQSQMEALARTQAQLQSNMVALLRAQQEEVDAIKNMPRPQVLQALATAIGPPEPGEVPAPVLVSDSQLRRVQTAIVERQGCLDREKLNADILSNCQEQVQKVQEQVANSQNTIAELKLAREQDQLLFDLRLKAKDAEIQKTRPSFIHRMWDKAGPFLIPIAFAAGLAI